MIGFDEEPVKKKPVMQNRTPTKKENSKIANVSNEKMDPISKLKEKLLKNQENRAK